MGDTMFIETEALLLALSGEEEALEKYMKQFLPGELRSLRSACRILSEACGDELIRQSR